MTDDIDLAFAHPLARAEATADRPADRISLRDHVVEADIGAFQPERGRTQRLRFNLVVEVRSRSGPLDDDVDQILSYDTLTEAIAAELGAERLNLLETLAERVAARILAEPQASRCFVRIEKLDRGPGGLGVEIVRARSDALPLAEREAARPVVVHLSDAAIASDCLETWLDDLAQTPAILCVSLPQGQVPQAGAPSPQRRIDLLAIEQNAWRLAARDRRCVVTGTRTELDWAMRQKSLRVWAPSKMVLDLPEAFADAGADAPALTVGLARLLHATRLIFVGVPGPEGSGAEVRDDASHHLL